MTANPSEFPAESEISDDTPAPPAPQGTLGVLPDSPEALAELYGEYLLGKPVANSDDTPSASTDLEPLDFAGLLQVLDYAPDECTALTVKLKADQKVSKIGSRDGVIAAAAHYTDKDSWFGINPTNCRRQGARGRSDEVKRLAALVIDGDDDKMSRAGIDQVIAEIAEMIGHPSAIIESGHGRQVYWPLRRADAEQLSNAEAGALSERFGLQIARLAAGRRGSVDTVSDLARMFRVPGSLNRKQLDAERPVIGHRDHRGKPVRVAELLAALDAAKVPAVTPGEAARDVVSPPVDWQFTGISCSWLASKISAWPTDTITTSRHRWLIAAATHVHCCRRRGCIADQDSLDAIKQALRNAFDARLAETPARKPDPPTEFEDCWRCGEGKAARKSDAEVITDTSGEHHHDAAGADADGDGHDWSQYDKKKRGAMTNGTETRNPLPAGDAGTPEPPAAGQSSDQHRDGASWEPQDLGRFIAGEFECPQPTMGIARSDGQRFIYPGREHAFVGETESGKTWLALACVSAEILAGGAVLYIHYEESDPSSTIQRLHLLGVDDDRMNKHMRFVAPYEAPRSEWIGRLLDPAPTMVIHDGVNEAMSLMGANTDKVDGASEFRRRLVTPFLRAGAASIACDHVAKDRESRGRDAYGSVHKGNVLDGARIALETVKPFGRGLRGVSYVYVTKDRPGQLRVHGTADEKTPGKTYIGTLVADDEQMFTPFSLMLYAPKPEEPADDEHRAIAVQDDVYGVIVEQPDHTVDSQRKLFALIRAAGYQFRESDIRRAVEDLLVMKSVVEIKGRNKAVGYQAIPSAARGSEDEC
jgi:hypothetical protein